MNANKITVLVDADPIVYRAGYAGQKITRRIVWSPPDDDVIYEDYFEPTETQTAHAQYKEWLEAKDEPDIVILEDEKIVVPEELDHVLSTVRAILRDIRYKVAENLGIDTDRVTLRVLLTGPGNFREGVATVAGYKANRTEDKPYWYQQIRNYLTEYWDAQVIEGREADDECSIECKKDPEHTVIATIDKDLDQVPGWHYNYGTSEKCWYRVDPVEAELFFYKQVLMGDSTDNIPGCYKIGRTRANRIIDELYAEYGMDHGKIWSAILATYDNSITQYGEACPYYHKACDEGVEAVVIEMARLVKMQDYLGQLWTPHDRPDDLLDMEFEE